MNLCRACGEDFSSVEAFDRHRVGVHDYTLTEGLHFDPPAEDGRRCLTIEELLALGWERNAQGRWHDPIRTSRAAFLLRAPESGTPEPVEASVGAA